ncbi:DUF167 domain-containing protein [Candidatus Woesearchaeota archaeon]|nr:DUF167 domain-containing protein [Candidatus Woesearchaeota archaeon]
MINIDKQIKVKVKPGAKKTEILGFENNFLVIKIKSMPQKGKANEELIKFLKKQFNKQARIIKGEKSKEKIIELF